MFTQWLQLKWRRAVPSVMVQCALEAGLSGCGVWSAGFRWQLLLGPPPCSLGPTQQCWAEDPEGPHWLLWPVGPAWQPALLLLSSPCSGVPLSSVSWPHTLQGLLLRSVTPESQADTRDRKLRTPAWQRLGLLEIELEDLCVRVFEEIKGHNFRDEYTVKNDQECTGGFYNMELLEEKIQPLK